MSKKQGCLFIEVLSKPFHKLGKLTFFLTNDNTFKPLQAPCKSFWMDVFVTSCNTEEFRCVTGVQTWSSRLSSLASPPGVRTPPSCSSGKRRDSRGDSIQRSPSVVLSRPKRHVSHVLVNVEGCRYSDRYLLAWCRRPEGLPHSDDAQCG